MWANSPNGRMQLTLITWLRTLGSCWEFLAEVGVPRWPAQLATGSRTNCARALPAQYIRTWHLSGPSFDSSADLRRQSPLPRSTRRPSRTPALLSRLNCQPCTRCAAIRLLASAGRGWHLEIAMNWGYRCLWRRLLSRVGRRAIRDAGVVW